MKMTLTLIVLIVGMVGCNNAENETIEVSYLEVNKENPFESGLKKVNSKLYQYEELKDKCNIALIDMNGNNNFTEVNKDAIHVFSKNEEDFQLQTSPKILELSNILRIDDRFLEIKLIDNQKIELVVKEGADLSAKLKMISEMPDFEITTIQGKTIKSKDLELDKRQTYIEFWGTWCKGCIEIMPKIKNLHENHPDKLRIISLAFNDTESDVIEFMKRHQMNWDVAIIDNEIRDKFNQIGFPRGYLFDVNNKLIDYNFHPDEYKIPSM